MKLHVVVFDDFGIVTVKTKEALERLRKMPDYRTDYLLDGVPVRKRKKKKQSLGDFCKKPRTLQEVGEFMVKELAVALCLSR